VDILDPAALEEDMDRREALRRRWAFWAVFVHDAELPRGAWAVDGVIRSEPFNEENLTAAVRREGAKKPVVAVSAPLHIDIAAIIGFHPPYGKGM
jgi:hypothetical protein